MNKTIKMLSGGLAGMALMTGVASAVPFGDGGAHLQSIFDGATIGPSAGVSSINVITDEIADGQDANWRINGSGGSFTTLMFNLTAAYAPYNQFGIYDASDPSKKISIFTGGTVGDQALVSIKADGSVYRNFADTTIDFAGNRFGYYLTTPAGDTWYSDTVLNTDSGDHMAAYQGKGTDEIQIDGLSAGLWGTGEYALAWEDLALSNSDRNYGDLVVMVESVTPAPDGGSSIILLGMSLMGLAFLKRK